MKTLCAIALLVLLALLAGMVGAQEGSAGPIESDRPGFADGTSIVPPGRIQLEAGYTFSRQGDEKQHVLGEGLLRVPAGDNAELRIGLPSYVWLRGAGERTLGFDDASLGFKLRLADGEGNAGGGIAVALIGAATLPTGASGIGAGGWQPSATLVLERDLGTTLSATINLGYTRARDDEQRFDQASAALEIDFALAERAGAYAEVFTLRPGSPHGSNQHYAGGGFTYLANNDTQLDLNGGIGLNGVRSDYFIGAGIARRW